MLMEMIPSVNFTNKSNPSHSCCSGGCCGCCFKKRLLMLMEMIPSVNKSNPSHSCCLGGCCCFKNRLLMQMGMILSVNFTNKSNPSHNKNKLVDAPDASRKYCQRLCYQMAKSNVPLKGQQFDNGAHPTLSQQQLSRVKYLQSIGCNRIVSPNTVYNFPQS